MHDRIYQSFCGGGGGRVASGAQGTCALHSREPPPPPRSQIRQCVSELGYTDKFVLRDSKFRTCSHYLGIYRQCISKFNTSYSVEW